MAGPSKLSSPFLGPYEVIQHVKNDVECRNLVQGNVQFFHVDRLKLFVGDREEALDLARKDHDQYVVKRRRVR